MRCCVLGCPCDHSECHFHTIRKNWNLSYSGSDRICECHFKAKHILISQTSGRRILTDNAAPDQREIKSSTQSEELRLLKIKLAKSEDERILLLSAMEKFLTANQIQKAKAGNVVYDAETLERAIEIKLRCGNKGYQYLSEELNYPLPNLRTVQRHMTVLKMYPGFQYEVIDFLGNIAAKNYESQSCHAVLVLDEMAMTVREDYNPVLKTLTGSISEELAKEEDLEIGSSNRLANHLMVFMIKFLDLPLKQVVCYYYTNDRIDRHKFKQEVIETITEIESLTPIKIHGLVCDMSGVNTGLWRAFGIESPYDSPFVPHPCDAARNLFFFPDATHLIKNFRGQFERTEEFSIVTDKQSALGFDIHNVNYAIFEDAVQVIERLQNKPLKLTMDQIHPKDSFQKMRVGPAVKIFSAVMSNFIDTLIADDVFDPAKKDIAKSTGHLCYLVSIWWKAISNKETVMSEEDVETLKNTILLMESLREDGNKVKKPSVIGIRMLCKGIVGLYSYCFDHNISFKTGNILSDCIENYFSQLRSYSNAIPSSLNIYYVMRLLSFSSSGRIIRGSQYDFSNDSYLLTFAELNLYAKELSDLSEVPSTAVVDCLEFVKLEQIAKAIFTHMKEKYPKCGCSSLTLEEIEEYLKSFEEHFQSFILSVLKPNVNIHTVLLDAIISKLKKRKNICLNHDTLEHLLSNFLTDRLRAYAKFTTQNAKKSINYSSRSTRRAAIGPNAKN